MVKTIWPDSYDGDSYDGDNNDGDNNDGDNKDRDEWKVLLDAMQKANIFTYSPETDTITLPAADAAEPEDAADE